MPLSPHVTRAYLLRHYRHPATNTTMSDWKAPMTKLVNQIYSKADAGKSFSGCVGQLKFCFPPFFTASCWTCWWFQGRELRCNMRSS